MLATKLLANHFSKPCLKQLLKRPPPSQPIPFKDLAKSAVLSYLAYREHSTIINMIKNKETSDIPIEWINEIHDIQDIPTYYDGKLNDLFSEDSQAYLWLLRENKTIYLVFRGSTTIEDFKSDIDFRHTNVKLKDSETIFKFHNGFYNQTMSILPQIIKTIQGLDQQLNNDSYDTIICAGHSLGSAMATIASALLYHEFPNKTITTHTFGGPRVGDYQFTQWFNSHIQNNWRVFNENDPVPTLPLSLRFHHVHNGLCIDDDFNIYEAKYDDPLHIRLLRLLVQIDFKNLIADHDQQCYTKRILKCCEPNSGGERNTIIK